ncbi:MAG: hypothetical protein PWQ48_1956 [Thermotogaceae bacterium]|nr:hypothetical protein [Thermotogaceae bacterium]
MILVLFFLFLFVSLYVVCFGKVNHRVKLGIIALMSLVTTYYIRVGFGRYFTTIDESYYISLTGTPFWYKTSPVSGFVVPFMLNVIRSLLHLNPLDLVIYYSLIFSIVNVVVIYWFYRKAGIKKLSSLLSLAILFISSYYIWPSLEIRPQQLGVLVGLVITAISLTSKPNRKFLVMLTSLFTLLVFTHVLSFVLFSALLILYLFLSFIREGSFEEIFRKFIYLSFAILLAWELFLLFPYSNRTVGNIAWIISSLLPFDSYSLLNSYFSIVSFVIYILVAYLIYYAAKVLNMKYRYTLISFWNNIREFSVNSAPKILLLGVLFLVVGFYLQFRLEARVYSEIYKNLGIGITYFQLGNMFFGLMFIRGMLEKLKDNKLKDLDSMAVIWTLIGAGMLCLSFFMPQGNEIWTFNNWMIRVVQYFVIFAAPTIAYVVEKDLQAIKNSNVKIAVPLLLSILIVISVLNTARIPQVYKYDLTWDDEKIEIAKKIKPFNTVMPKNNASPYEKFAMENLLQAYGKHKIIGGGKEIVLSSDNIYVTIPEYISSTLGDFLNVKKPVVVISGSLDMEVIEEFIEDFNNILPVLTMDSESCESYLKLEYPIIAVGGKLTNSCTKMLEEKGSVPVYVEANYVLTPKAMYAFSASSKDWWDVNEGSFVIQAVEYYGSHILIIEGTNIDATVAGVWYFVTTIAQDPDTYKDIHYIVGKWKEADGRVLKQLKFSLKDSNGFSEGDTIEILEMA